MLDKEYIVILHGLYTDCSLICVKPCKGKKRLSAVAGSLFLNECTNKSDYILSISFVPCLFRTTIFTIFFPTLTC